VADFFCGSGTFPSVAARLGRRFLACDATWRAFHTTRSRLVETALQPFACYVDSSVSRPLIKSPLVLKQDTRRGTLTLVPPNHPLDYWEIDPDWNGSIFRSVAQVRRTNRSSEVPLEIKKPLYEGLIRARAVTVGGEMLETK
jgi:hypothetical protein